MSETLLFIAFATENKEFAVDYERRRPLTIGSNLVLLLFGMACLWKGIDETRIGFSIDAFYFYFMFLLCVGAFFYLPVFSGGLRADLWKRKNPTGKREYRFYEDEFELSTEEAWTRYEYAQLTRVVETKMQIALVVGNLVFPVDKAKFCEGDPQQLASFLKEKRLSAKAK